MPRIAKADLDDIFADDIADVVTIAGNTVRGHFFQPYAGALDIEGSRPEFKCESGAATAAGAVRGATLVFGLVNYTIEQVRDESSGVTVLVLSQQ